MVTATAVLILFAALVTLSILRPAGPFPAPADRDRQRQLDELRALRGYCSDAQLR